METDAKKKEKYLSPQLKTQHFSLEKGFAISGDTDYDPSTGNGGTAGERWDTETIVF